jgi:hypothetical protein
MDKFLKINFPCERLKFFQNCMILFVVQFICAVTFWVLTTYVTGFRSILWLTPLFLIFVELPLLYMYFVQCARRTYSILGVRKISLIVSIFLFLLSLIGIIYFPILAVLIFVMFLLVPERDMNV